MTRKLGLLAAISVLVTIVLTAPGCNSGCLDKFDCGTGAWKCVKTGLPVLADGGVGNDTGISGTCVSLSDAG